MVGTSGSGRVVWGGHSTIHNLSDMSASKESRPGRNTATEQN